MSNKFTKQRALDLLNRLLGIAEGFQTLSVAALKMGRTDIADKVDDLQNNPLSNKNLYKRAIQRVERGEDPDKVMREILSK